MSYQVLARKWRPSNFGEMTGQQHVLQALVNALDNDRLHHAYLFTGTRGVGKTTVARILAKCLNCETGVTATPCGVCSSCIEIAEGRCVDLLEVDAASRTKVDDTRELLDNVQYAPTRARFKIYLIDEVHMLSGHSFNALLKTLEEPPPHAKFLLATTDPQKLPATVLSRCLQFNLKNMLPSQIVERLAFILSEESVDHDPESLRLLAHAAAGSMRDALSLTDQAIAFCGGALAEAGVRGMLGTVDRGRVLAIAEAVLDGDAGAAMSAVSALAEHAPDYPAALEELASVLHRVALTQLVPETIDPDDPESAALRRLAQGATADVVQLCYQIAVSGRAELALASDPRVGLEMLLLRMIVFRPGVVVTPAVEGPSPAKKPEPPAVPVDALSASPEPAIPPPKVPAVPTSTAAPSPPVAATNFQHDCFPEDWPPLYERLGLTGLLGSVMLHAELTSARADTWTFVLDATHAGLYNPRQREQLERALSAALGRALQVDLTVGQVGSNTPAAHRAREAARQLAAAQAALTADPVLQALMATFDAQIIPGSIRAPKNEHVSDEDY